MTPTTQAGATSADETKTPQPGDLLYHSEWETKRTISHREAQEVAHRLTASHFRRTDCETARASIPANPDRDDDLLIISYIKQQARRDAALPSPAVVPESVRRLSEAATQDELNIGNMADGWRYTVCAGPMWDVIGYFQREEDAAFFVAAGKHVRTLIADAPPSGRAAEGGDVVSQRADILLALEAALVLLGRNEPGDSRAVSDEFVAIASAVAGRMNDEARQILLGIMSGPAPTPPASAGDVDEGPFRVGRKVPRNVYEGDRPLFMAASDEEAARLVTLLNGATAPAAPEPAAGGERAKMEEARWALLRAWEAAPELPEEIEVALTKFENATEFLATPTRADAGAEGRR